MRGGRDIWCVSLSTIDKDLMCFLVRLSAVLEPGSGFPYLLPHSQIGHRSQSRIKWKQRNLGFAFSFSPPIVEKRSTIIGNVIYLGTPLKQHFSK